MLATRRLCPQARARGRRGRPQAAAHRHIVIHRANIERVDELVTMAIDMGASRVEIAHVQYYGWALKNRAALMPTREQVERAVGRIEPLRKASRPHRHRRRGA